MDWLLDTNLVLRFSDKRAALHEKACDCVHALLSRGELLHLTAQNLTEFWAVATRPEEANGLGWSCAATDNWLSELERVFLFVEESPSVFPEWRKIVLSQGVQGKRVHDARLVAVMTVNGLSHLVTFNTQDFLGFKAVQLVHPDDVLAGRA